MKDWEILIPGQEDRQIKAASYSVAGGVVYFNDDQGKMIGIVIAIPGLIVKPASK